MHHYCIATKTNKPYPIVCNHASLYMFADECCFISCSTTLVSRCCNRWGGKAKGSAQLSKGDRYDVQEIEIL